MKERRRISVLGTVGAGKTTWLGAITDGLMRGVPSRIKLDSWPDDVGPLYRATERLQQGEYPQRTAVDGLSVLELPIKVVEGPNKDKSFSLAMGDYSGETVENLFRERTEGWSDAWKRRAQADALMVLLRHDVSQPLRVLHPKDAPATTPATRKPRAKTPEELYLDPLPPKLNPEKEKARQDDPRYVPTTLAIMELLQWVRHERGLIPGEHPGPTNPFRVGVVLTAWDAIPAPWNMESPEKFLRENHSLLWDFLQCNFDREDFRVFAVSATGGDLKDTKFRQKYLEAEEPTSRVYWSHGAKRRENPDLSLPLCWGLYGEDELLHL